jgi:hypothetical protein
LIIRTRRARACRNASETQANDLAIVRRIIVAASGSQRAFALVFAFGAAQDHQGRGLDVQQKTRKDHLESQRQTDRGTDDNGSDFFNVEGAKLRISPNAEGVEKKYDSKKNKDCSKDYPSLQSE